MIAPAPLDILRFAADELAAGRSCALVTLVGIEGSSPRGVGAQMAVAGNGRSIGSFSGGCIEAAVIAEAVDTIAAGSSRNVRFGIGSPYLDVKLPCGGGIDLLFTPVPDSGAISAACGALEGRQPARLAFEWTGADDEARQFDMRYKPGLKIVAAGQGDDLVALARLGRLYGIEVEVSTPDKNALMLLQAEAIHATGLNDRMQFPDIATDPWTAIVFLFHDRDWEELLLPQALARPAFYIGAVGSPNTHAARLEHLRAAPVDERTLARLRGPIGLIPSTRDPATLALSIFAEIVSVYQGIDP